MKTNLFRLLIALLPIILPDFLFAQDRPYIIMLSLDGFRWDYPQLTSLPTLDSLARTGVKAASLRPAFPSVTFPNHYTMATGLYPDHHGIVANSFYDPQLNRSYAIRDRLAVEDGIFYGGEPIWVTAEKQGVTSASFFWVGSEAPVMGIRPTYWKKYDEKIPLADRGDTVLAWLSMPEEKRPHLILFYYHEPDAAGHHHGPESKEVKEVVSGLDKELRAFFRKLNTHPLAGQVNVIVTSDHGMQSTSREQSVSITDYVNKDWFEIIEGYSPVVLFKVKPAFDSVADVALKKIPHCTAWRTAEVPAHLHYGTNPRTLDFVLLADSAWSIRLKPEQRVSAGAHGYDPSNKNMHAIFYASGPAFRKNLIIPEFENTDLYLIITHILKLNPAPVDGKMDRIMEMFENF